MVESAYLNFHDYKACERVEAHRQITLKQEQDHVIALQSLIRRQIASTEAQWRKNCIIVIQNAVRRQIASTEMKWRKDCIIVIQSNIRRSLACTELKRHLLNDTDFEKA